MSNHLKCIAKLQLCRLMARESQLKRLIGQIKKMVEESETEAEVAGKTLNETRIIEMLLEVVKLHEDYSATCKLVSSDEVQAILDDDKVAIIKDLKDNFDTRDGRLKEALQLICYIVDCYRK